LGLIGAGSFATGTLIPGLLAAGFEPLAVASASGLSAESARRRFGFASSHADPGDIIGRADVDLVAIATRHDSHAELAALALEAGKAVYVEKPLSLDWEGLSLVRASQRRSGAPLIVGFNRRFAPLTEVVRRLPGPRLMAYRVNAGRLPRNHWMNDLARGGGRLKGEGCHFIDFLCDQAIGDPVRVTARGFSSRSDLPLAATDNFSVEIWFDDGSVGTLHYAADAPIGPGKERFELSGPGVYAEIDDYRRGRVWHGRRKQRLGRGRQDKGFAAQFDYLAKLMRGDLEAPTADDLWLTTLVTLAAARSLETGEPELVLEADRRPRSSAVPAEEMEGVTAHGR
jgi:predicted dehydrogenase